MAFLHLNIKHQCFEGRVWTAEANSWFILPKGHKDTLAPCFKLDFKFTRITGKETITVPGNCSLVSFKPTDSDVRKLSGFDCGRCQSQVDVFILSLQTSCSCLFSLTLFNVTIKSPVLTKNEIHSQCSFLQHEMFDWRVGGILAVGRKDISYYTYIFAAHQS